MCCLAHLVLTTLHLPNALKCGNERRVPRDSIHTPPIHSVHFLQGHLPPYGWAGTPLCLQRHNSVPIPEAYGTGGWTALQEIDLHGGLFSSHPLRGRNFGSPHSTHKCAQCSPTDFSRPIRATIAGSRPHEKPSCLAVDYPPNEDNIFLSNTSCLYVCLEKFMLCHLKIRSRSEQEWIQKLYRYPRLTPVPSSTVPWCLHPSVAPLQTAILEVRLLSSGEPYALMCTIQRSAVDGICSCGCWVRVLGMVSIALSSPGHDRLPRVCVATCKMLV